MVSFHVLIMGVVLSAAQLRGDVLHLQSGDTLEGEILDDGGEVYRIRTTMGISDIEKARVVRIEKGDPPWVRYERIRAATAETVQGHLSLARWCRDADMHREERHHLEEVLKREPDQAEARKLLGFVRKDGQWVPSRTPQAPSSEELAARRKKQREQKLISDKIAEYTVKVKAIHRGRLAPRSQDRQGRSFDEGRQLILELRDPLAIHAISSVLSTGNIAARKLMVEALAQFSEEEATMNLMVIGLLEPSPEVRRLAALEVAKRRDPRIIDELRKALGSDEEFILRNAATMLGLLRAREAVDDLIDQLTTDIIRPVRISRWVSLDSLYGRFAIERRYSIGGFSVLYRPYWFGTLGPGTIIGTQTDYQLQAVTIHRTEVQEALIAITGKNFGFDHKAWEAWAMNNRP